MIATILAFLGSGVGTAFITEALSWLNKKLAGTPLDGAAPFLFSFAAAFLMATIQIAVTGVSTPHSVHDILVIAGAVWIASQAFFQLVMKQVDAIHVTPSADPSQPLA
ncbi:MAG TPA: hypothetical protein VLC46_26915 [Thermoanaerobaculia bacterium]|jgi:hypothetical protein|nr:hypothetical protein [Thermoanaerobaculia bacterium]